MTALIVFILFILPQLWFITILGGILLILVKLCFILSIIVFLFIFIKEFEKQYKITKSKKILNIARILIYFNIVLVIFIFLIIPNKKQIELEKERIFLEKIKIEQEKNIIILQENKEQNSKIKLDPRAIEELNNWKMSPKQKKQIEDINF